MKPNLIPSLLFTSSNSSKQSAKVWKIIRQIRMWRTFNKVITKGCEGQTAMLHDWQESKERLMFSALRRGEAKLFTHAFLAPSSAEPQDAESWKLQPKVIYWGWLMILHMVKVGLLMWQANKGIHVQIIILIIINIWETRNIDKCHKAWSVSTSPKPSPWLWCCSDDAYITSLTRSQQRTLCPFSSSTHTTGKKLYKQETILQLHTPTMKPINPASKNATDF